MFDAQDLPSSSAGARDAHPSAPPGTSQPIHLLDRLNAIFRHRRLAGTAFVLVIALMMLQTYSTIPVYQAQSRIQIQDERSQSMVPCTSGSQARKHPAMGSSSSEASGSFPP